MHATYDLANYDFWLDKWCRKLGLPPVIAGPALALTVLATALVVVVPFGAQVALISSPAFWLGVFGIALVLASVPYGIQLLLTGLQRLEEGVVDKPAYQSYVGDVFRRGASCRTSRYWYGAAGTCALAVVIYVGIAYTRSPGKSAERGHLVQASLYSDSVIPLVLAVGIFAIPTFLISFSVIELLVRNLGLLLKLPNRTWAPMPAFVRATSRTLISRYVAISFAWFIGVSLVVALVVAEITFVTGAVVGVLVLLGTATLLVPYVAVRSVIARSHRAMLLSLWADIQAQGPVVVQVGALDEFQKAHEVFLSKPPPVFTRGDIAVTGTGYLLTAGAVVAKALAENQIVDFVSRVT